MLCGLSESCLFCGFKILVAIGLNPLLYFPLCFVSHIKLYSDFYSVHNFSQTFIHIYIHTYIHTYTHIQAGSGGETEMQRN